MTSCWPLGRLQKHHDGRHVGGVEQLYSQQGADLSSPARKLKKKSASSWPSPRPVSVCVCVCVRVRAHLSGAQSHHQVGDEGVLRLS